MRSLRCGISARDRMPKNLIRERCGMNLSYSDQDREDTSRV